MRRFPKLTVAAFIFFLTPLACDHPTFAPAPPPNPLAVTITIAGYSYPGAVTIRPGGTVCWINPSSSFSPHTVQVDNGAGGCQVDQTVSIGTTICINFPASGTYEYHCSYHGFCATACTGCSGMAGKVAVQ